MMINYIKTAIFMGVLFFILLVIGYTLGGVTGLTVALVIALSVNFFTYWYSDKIVLKMYKANEADTEEYSSIYEILRDVTQRANLPMPRLFIIKSDTPNAFATGRNPENAVVALTTGILKILNERELKGVIAHEVSHIKNRDILIASFAAVIAGAISYIALFARFGAIFGGGRDGENIIGILVLSIVAPLIAMVVSFAISRSREYLADSMGASLSKDPIALADALQKLSVVNKVHPMKNANPATSHMFIVNPFSAKSVINLFSTHPPVQKRIGKLRSMAANR